MSAVLGQIRPINIQYSPLYHAQREQPNYLVYFFVISLLLHALLLLVHFSDPLRKAKESGPAALQVVLVNSKSAQRPVKADALAQANLEGGGNTDVKAVATTPFPVQKDAEPQPELKTRMQQVRELEQQQARLLTQIKSKPSANLPAPPTQAQPEPGQTPNATDLLARSLEIARLEAQIDRNHNAYQSRPKRKNIGARTEEYRFAQYVENWRLKVERVGNLNYPEEARQKKLYGSLRITVNILADGNLESAEVDRSSGSKILDEAALRIIKMGAPYAPLPENIRKDTDILGITRTLSFTRSDQLASQ
jgi:protein TonB